MKPLLESFGGEGGDAALGRDVSDKLHDVANEWQLRREIHQARSIRCEPRPEIDIAEGVGIQRAHAALIVVRKKFCFVCGDVDAYGAIALAAFAGEAEIEGSFDLFAAPSIADDGVAAVGILCHLPEQMSAAAGRVFFFVGGAPTGTHHAAFFAAAFANANATKSRMRKTAVIGRELEVRLGLPVRVIRTEAQIFVELVRRLPR